MSFKLFLKIIKFINESNVLSFVWFEVYLLYKNCKNSIIYKEKTYQNHSKWILIYDFWLLIALVLSFKLFTKINKFYV